MVDVNSPALNKRLYMVAEKYGKGETRECTWRNKIVYERYA
jgi:hypothetical protein